MCEIRVLGPIAVDAGAEIRPVTARNLRLLLAGLVMSVNHAVLDGALVQLVWGDEPPASAHGTLQHLVSELRHLLGTKRVRFDDDAYVLEIAPDEIDAVRFEQLVLDAGAALADGDAERSRGLAMDALSLWRGPAFGDLGDEEQIYLAARRLDELRLTAMELRLECDVVLGGYSQAIPLLESTVAEHPYRERPWYLLITALAREGRRVESLRAVGRLREILGEIGLEPSRDIQELESAVLVEAPEVRARLLVGPDEVEA